MNTFGDDFTQKMQELLGEQSPAFFESLEKPSIKGITLNTYRLSREEFEEIADFEHVPIPETSNGYIVNDLKIGKHILSHLGVIYSQEPSAMYPVEMLDIEKGDIVLDLCSAPGGKSIQILEKLQGTGLLVSNEIVYNRAKILYENLTRMGFDNFAITCNSPQDFEKTSLKFDKILVDAPCGGEGMFRKSNFDFNAYNSCSIETNAKRQLSILESIKNLLKPNGKIVYSTCTYDIRENEGVISEFLQNNPDFTLIDCPRLNSVTTAGIKIGDTNTTLCKRRYPHLFDGEGQFMTLMQKASTETEECDEDFDAKGFKKLYRKEVDQINKCLKGIINTDGLSFVSRGDNFYLLPDTTLNFENLNVVTIGTLIGTMNKGNLKIAHEFYHTHGDKFLNEYNLTYEELEKYLMGYELDVDGNTTGICAVKYSRIPLGGGKIAGGRLKNYYPQNLRN